MFGSSGGHDRCFLGNDGGGGESGGVSGSSVWGAVDGSGTVEVTKIMEVRRGGSGSGGGMGMAVMGVSVVEGYFRLSSQRRLPWENDIWVDLNHKKLDLHKSQRRTYTAGKIKVQEVLRFPCLLPHSLFWTLSCGLHHLHGSLGAWAKATLCGNLPGECSLISHFHANPSVPAFFCEP